MTDEEKVNIKYRLSDIGKQVGVLALEYIADLEKENAELKKDKEWLDNTNNEQTEVILKLNEQIEKMKCCQNCKHSFSEGLGCIQRAKQNWCYNYALWELAE